MPGVGIGVERIERGDVPSVQIREERQVKVEQQRDPAVQGVELLVARLGKLGGEFAQDDVLAEHGVVHQRQPGGVAELAERTAVARAPGAGAAGGLGFEVLAALTLTELLEHGLIRGLVPADVRPGVEAELAWLAS